MTLLKKVDTTLERVKNRAYCALATFTTGMYAMAASATDTPSPGEAASLNNSKITGALKTALHALGSIVAVLGAFFLIMGIIHYASANSEGDGPAKQKATQQMAAGGMVLIVALLLATGKFDTIVTGLI